jgi:hypothetical protein
MSVNSMAGMPVFVARLVTKLKSFMWRGGGVGKEGLGGTRKGEATDFSEDLVNYFDRKVSNLSHRRSSGWGNRILLTSVRRKIRKQRCVSILQLVILGLGFAWST